METFKFLITTDNHMGFKEDDHIRRKDSYMAFKEALSIARQKDVDFILLGGDLFHMNRPSASIEHKCIKIIREHMNAPTKRGTSFKRVKGNFCHFHRINHANFEDINLTVPYPIMTIHGNHDDPTGPNAQSICEKLATCGLINYFGALKANVKSIKIEPIVLQKANVKIALYGLGFISDLKLKQAFENNEVVFIEPPRDSYNILVIHQNRVPYNKAKFIPDDVFPLNFHLIIRGHEHDTQCPEPIPESEVNGLVYQPGSTVATSISNMEASKKKVGFFTIGYNDDHGGDLKSMFHVQYELIDLKCCRRMLLKDVSQKSIYGYIKSKIGTRVLSTDFQRLSKEYVIKCIKELLDEDKEQRLKTINATAADDDDDNLKLKRFTLPLMRIRLEYTQKSERFDELEVGSMFYPQQVANKDIVAYKKQKLAQDENGETINTTFTDDNNTESQSQEQFDEFEHINLGEEKRDIDYMIESYFKDKIPEDRLQALSLTEYTNAVRGTGEDGNVISKVLSAKKMTILNKFKKLVQNNETASYYSDEDLVRKWFLEAFKKNIGEEKSTADSDGDGGGGGDEPEVMICE